MLNDLFIFHTITQTHVGSGTGLGLIDNPVIRHKRNSFSYIPSSSIKGTLKSHYRSVIDKEKSEDFKLVFGPETDRGTDHASGLGMLDGEILFFPVRSLKGVFGWITCPSILKEFKYRLQMLGHEFSELDLLIDDLNLLTKNTHGLVAKCDNKIVNKTKTKSDSSGKSEEKYTVNFEEYSLNVLPHEAVGNFLNKLGAIWNDKTITKDFEENTLVVEDDLFSYYINYATSVVPNIKIEQKTGVTEKGSLRYTEFLPELSVFYSAFTYQHIKDNDPGKIREKFTKQFPLPKVIQIGADYTLGKGLIAMKLFSIPQKGDNHARK